jgi:hypothetical protein
MKTLLMAGLMAILPFLTSCDRPENLDMQREQELRRGQSHDSDDVRGVNEVDSGNL